MNVDAISMFGGDLCWLRDGGRQCWCTSYDEALLGSGELDDSMIWRHTRRVPLQR